MDRRSILIRNVILSLAALALAVVALLAPGIESLHRAAIVGAVLGYLPGLWTHSGRRRREGSLADSLPPVPPMPMPPAVLLLGLALALAACRGNHLFTVELPQASEAGGVVASGIASDSVALTPQATFACPSGKSCIWADSATGRIKLRGTDAVDLEAGEARKLQSLASDPSASNGEIWYNSVSGEIHFYAGGAYSVMPADSGLVHRAGTETITGVKTFSAAPVLGAGLTASGSSSNNFSGSSGAFLTSTGAATFGGSSNAFTNAASFNGAVTLGDAAADVVTVKGALRVENSANSFYASISHAVTANRAVTLPDAAGQICIDGATQTLSGKTLTAPVLNGATSASGNFDLSGSSGTTKTTTGAVTIGPGAVGISGDVTLTSTKTLAAGANTLISGDKLQASKLAIGSQATGDILYASSSSAWTRLGVGSNGDVLTLAGGVPTWAAAGGGGSTVPQLRWHPADRPAQRGITPSYGSSDISYGTAWIFTKAGLIVTGIRAYWGGAATVTMKLWLSDGSVGASCTASPAGAGVTSCNFGTPYTIAAGDVGKLLIASTYDGAHYTYAPGEPPGPFPIITRNQGPMMAGPYLYQMISAGASGFYAAGDAMPNYPDYDGFTELIITDAAP